MKVTNYTKTGVEISFFLVRHGESETNVNERSFLSNYDYALTKKGISQIKELGRWARKNIDAVDYIYCSPFQRSRQTAELLARQFSIPKKHIRLSDDLRELDIGEWNGQKRRTVLTGEAVEKIYRLDKWFSTSEGESGMALQSRARRWLESEILSLPARRHLVIIVSVHAYWTKLFLQSILNFDYKFVDKIKLGHASISHLKLSDDGWSVEYLNNILQ